MSDLFINAGPVEKAARVVRDDMLAQLSGGAAFMLPAGLRRSIEKLAGLLVTMAAEIDQLKATR